MRPQPPSSASPRLLLAPKLHGQRVRAALTDDAAYVVGLAQLVAEPRVLQVTPCLDSGNVLIAREVYENTLVPGAAAEAASEVQLLLYSARRRRCTVVFRHRPQPGEQARLGMFLWWVGGEYASFSLHLSRADGQERQVLPLLLNIPAERVSPIKVNLPRNVSAFHLPSPTRPFALLVQDETPKQPGRVYRVGTDGNAVRIRDDGAATNFLPDGESYLLVEEKENQEVVYTVFNVLTGTTRPVSVEEGARLETQQVGQDDRDQSLAGKLPLKLVQRLSKGEPSVPLLFLAPQKSSEGEETFLLGDAEPAGISQDMKALFYFQQGLLYLLPLQKLPKKAFLEGRDRELRELTLRRAKTLRQNILPNYMSTHDQKWPAPGTPLEDLFEGRPRDLGLTQNPLTGHDDLRFEYDGFSDFQGKGTRVASLGGPGGRAAIFGDGQVVWEPTRRP